MTFALEERVMVSPQTVHAGLAADTPGDVMRALTGGKNIVSVSRHDGFLVDMVNDSIHM